MGSKLIGALVALMALVAVGCSTAHECGDGVCSGGEDPFSCAVDCQCGNGSLDVGEECDGDFLGGATCATLGLEPGLLQCGSTCSFDVSECGTSVCGNGEIEPGEDCEPGDLGGQTCGDLGFSVGDLACGSNCLFDFSGCCNDQCNDSSTRCDDDTVQSCVAGPNGCNVWQDDTDCTATSEYCDDSEGAAVCTCVDRCIEDASRCDGGIAEQCQMTTAGCLDWVSILDCGTTTDTCAVGPDGPVCAPAVAGDDCSAPYPLVEGLNVVAHTATNLDYMSSPPCGSYGYELDVVMEYTAQITGALEFTFDKPASNSTIIAASDQSCGNVSSALTCSNDYSPSQLFGAFPITAGSTYYFYVVDGSSFGSPVPSPLVLDVREIDCTGFAATPSNPSPAVSATTTTLRPTLSIDFDTEVNPTAGVVQVTGNLGTNLSYDLSAAPAAVSFTNTNRTMTITPAAPFQPGETITVTWNGVVDQRCGNDVAQPAWTFEVIDPPCAPGTGGVIGSSMNRASRSLALVSQYYVAADTDPSGWVYVGDTSALERTSKTTGTIENVYTAASLSTSHTGYTMLVNGDDIFTINESASTTGVLWRISTDGGANWTVQDYATFPSTPNSGIRGAVVDGGTIYMITFSSTAPQIWSVPADAATLPATPTLVGTVTSAPGTCSGLAMDDDYFYTACDGSDQLMRINRTTYAAELIYDGWDLSVTVNHLYTQDPNGDGAADVLYVKGWTEEVWYVCSPGGTTPYADLLVDLGASSYGMGFDPTSGLLWTFDDSADEIVSIE